MNRCTCGHPVDGHQTGDGPWTGFCGDPDCKCELPIPDPSDPRWPGYLGAGGALEDYLVAPPNAKDVTPRALGSGHAR